MITFVCDMNRRSMKYFNYHILFSCKQRSQARVMKLLGLTLTYLTIPFLFTGWNVTSYYQNHIECSFNEKYIAASTVNCNLANEISETDEHEDTNVHKHLFFGVGSGLTDHSILIIWRNTQADFIPRIFFFFQTDSSPPVIV